MNKILKWIIIAAGIFIVLGFIGGLVKNKPLNSESSTTNLVANVEPETPTSKESNQPAQTLPMETSNKKVPDLINKNSGFTLNDCNKLCDMTYDTQIQVDVCENSCAMIGKEGSTMDVAAKGIITVYKQQNGLS